MDTVPQRPRRQKTEGLLTPHLPAAAVDENQKRYIYNRAMNREKLFSNRLQSST